MTITMKEVKRVWYGIGASLMLVTGLVVPIVGIVSAATGHSFLGDGLVGLAATILGVLVYAYFAVVGLKLMVEEVK